MLKSTGLIVGTALCFTLLVAWFAWSAFRAAPQLATENLRGAGLSISAAIEQLAAVEPSFRALARYSTPDIAYFSLSDHQGIIRFHTNPGLIGTVTGNSGSHKTSSNGISEQRELLGTGEEVYLLRTRIHPAHSEYLLLLALHTYRADQVIRRAGTGVSVVAALTLVLWGLTGFVLFMMRREEQHHHELQRREELARLGEMGAVMAHEIRNPLAGIKGFAQLIETTSDITQAKHYAAKVVSQSLRMESLVNDLLAFVREEQGQREATDLSALLGDCVTLLKGEADAQQVAIVLESDHDIRIPADSYRIMQLVLNLMKNGIQAMPDGGVLSLKLRSGAQHALITVSDSGAGIPPEHLGHIFEPFWTSKASGTGLGLALCRKISEEHGGSLTVENRVGGGTSFTAAFPLAG
ncbi:MAG: histidine kinase [Geobacteraceae bacterium]|nr:histidine kinase [Geobacteraceae bacterium]